MISKKHFFMRAQTVLFALLILALLLVSGIQAQAQENPEAITLTGWIQVTHGDGQPGSGQTPQTVYHLLADDGQTYPLEIDARLLQEAGGALALRNKRVQVALQALPGVLAADQTMPYQVEVLTPLPSEAGAADVTSLAVTGSQPWVSILCKFNDISAEPKSLPYFTNMYNNAYPALDHYWRDLSYGQINLVGSTAVGWFNLPRPRSAYFSGSAFNLNLAAQDCLAVADPYLHYPTYKGINLMFNADLDGYAWGGYRYYTLDGVYGRWNITWEPPWAYSDITVIAHEMGHGFGLPHSSGMYGYVYDNVWDVMSDADANCAKSTHVTYGCLGQHTIAFHKDMLGWIPADKKYTVAYTTSTATPQTTSNRYLMAQIPVLGSLTRFYTVEVRNFSGYDIKLPGKAVIIHEVQTSRSEPAQVVDVDLNGNTGDAGAMWVVGETFNNSASQVSVAVLAASGDAFQVRISNGTQVVTLWLEPLAPQAGIFSDVSVYYWAYSFIERLYTSGITTGCSTSPLRYCPTTTVTRDQMAVFLLRGINGSAYTPLAADGGTGFADVPVNYWAAGWIKQLASTGITTGCGNGNYCPTSPVTRDQMAVFLLRSKYGAAYTPPPAGGSTGFADVPPTHWAAAWIKQLAAEGITGGCGNGNYCPSSPVTRDQMAVFLVRTFNLP